MVTTVASFSFVLNRPLRTYSNQINDELFLSLILNLSFTNEPIIYVFSTL